VIGALLSGLCKAGQREPSLTRRASPETCFKRWLIAKPFSGSGARIFNKQETLDALDEGRRFAHAYPTVTEG